jgi:hypothetical protein
VAELDHIGFVLGYSRCHDLRRAPEAAAPRK